MTEEHVLILKSFDEIPFSVGRKTMIDFITGNENPTIKKHDLSGLNSYGILKKISPREADKIFNFLLENNLTCYETINNGYQVLKRTHQGKMEISEQKFSFRRSAELNKKEFQAGISEVTEEDRKTFSQFSSFLEGYNEEQKKSVISANKSILCIAGAGTGKTSVLVKRIEFLKRFRSVSQEKILAVTFTRKARKEMKKRLLSLGIEDAHVETFNSFCEKMLRKFRPEYYGKEETRVANFGDKVRIVRNATEKMKINPEDVFRDYFTKRQLTEKNTDELFLVFVNDVFSIMDYYKNREQGLKNFHELERDSSKKKLAERIHGIVKTAWDEMHSGGLRDFSDQIPELLKLFRKRKDLIPRFEHVLVDEFQDLNHVQYEMLKLLNPENIFIVGDPRQAIYGWRGSDVRFMTDFRNDFGRCETMALKLNYRSVKSIVEVLNSLIEGKGFADLTSTRDSDEESVFLFEHDNETAEKVFITEAIKNSASPREEIFVLARTNRIIEGFSDHFSREKIEHVLKSEDDGTDGEKEKGKVILATVHSIKGMEAKEVYLTGANSLSFPNKVQENFVLSLVKNSRNYDKEEEELRLFYVALSRAKDKLVINYAGGKSEFINDKMLKKFRFGRKNKTLNSFMETENQDNMKNDNSAILKNLIREWRTKKANETGLPSYMIISNATLDDIIFRKPRTKNELKSVKGFGDVKTAKYGDEIIKILSETG